VLGVYFAVPHVSARPALSPGASAIAACGLGRKRGLASSPFAWPRSACAGFQPLIGALGRRPLCQRPISRLLRCSVPWSVHQAISATAHQSLDVIRSAMRRDTLPMRVMKWCKPRSQLGRRLDRLVTEFETSETNPPPRRPRAAHVRTIKTVQCCTPRFEPSFRRR